MLTEERLPSGMSVVVAEGAAGRRPAVILLHERYGIDQHTRDLVGRLGDARYVAAAPDLFWRYDGDRDAVRRGDGRVELRDDECLTDLDETIRYLRDRGDVDGGRMVIIGVCQSGRQPLLLAAHRNDLSGAVVLYGGVGRSDWEPNELRPASVGAFVDRLSCPILGLFGEADHVVAVEDVYRFRDRLEAAGKGYRIRIYPDVPHGWLNDTMPGRYRPEAARDAWDTLLAFLEEVFSGTPDPTRIRRRFESDVSISYDFSKNRRLS